MLLTAVPFKVFKGTKIHKYGVSTPFVSEAGEGETISPELTDILDAFSHFVFNEMSGECVLTDFEYTVEDKIITIVDFAPPEKLVDAFRRDHRCNKFCSLLQLELVA